MRQVAATLGVSHQTVYRYRRAGRLPPVPDATANDPPPPPAADQSPTVGRSERNQLDAAAPLGMATCNVAGRMAASLGGLGPALPCFAALETVAKGGVLTALPALLRVGLLDHLALLGPVPGYYGPHSVFLLRAFLLLARVLNPERLRYEQPGEWGRLLGLDRSCAPDTLRRKLGELAVSAGAVAAWREALTRQWLDEAAGEAATLIVDGHVQVYTGQARLPKHFVSRARLQLPAAAGYWVHAPGGMPLLCLHKQVDAGMVAELRTAVVPQLEQLGLLEPRVDGEPSLTLAFDREGWSPELLRDLRERGTACVTWCKGRQQERRHDTEFRQAEFPLRTPFGVDSGRGWIAERTMTLLQWKLTVREIRFWIEEREPPAGRSGQRRKPHAQAGKPSAVRRQASVLTTRLDWPAEQVAGLLKSRWSQEANCKWMHREYGLDTLAEHATEEVAAETRVVNPGAREIRRGLQRLREKSGRLRRQEAQLGSRHTAQARKRRQAVRAEIQAVEREIAGLERARRCAPLHVLAGELPPELRLRALPAARRGLQEGLRLIAYRAETALAAVLAPHLGKPAEVRALTRALLQSAVCKGDDILG